MASQSVAQEILGVRCQGNLHGSSIAKQQYLALDRASLKRFQDWRIRCTGSAGLQARVQGREEKSLQPLRSTTSAAEANNCAGVLNAGLKARTTRVTAALESL